MAEVLGRVLQPLAIRESTLVFQFGRVIACDDPRSCAANRLAVDRKSAPHPQEDMLRFLRNRSVRLQADVQDQHAVLGYIGNPEVIRQVATLSLFRIFDVATHLHIVPLVGGA